MRLIYWNKPSLLILSGVKKLLIILNKNSLLNYVQIYKWGWDQKKKVEKNPNLKRVPTIDEFGGYWKFNNSSTPLDKVNTIDYNEKIRILDQECEKEYGPLPGFETKTIAVKRRKTQDFENYDKNMESEVMVIPKFYEEEFLFSSHKKLKRERYCSDLTNVTKSNILKPLALDEYVNPFFEEEVPSEQMGGFNFDSGEYNFCHNSFQFDNVGKFEV